MPGARLSLDARLCASPLHVPDLADALWQKVLQMVREPVVVKRTRGLKTVQVVGISRFLERTDGTWHVLVADLVPHAPPRRTEGREHRISGPQGEPGTVVWNPLPPEQLALIALPAGWFWLRRICRLFASQLAAEWRALGQPAHWPALDAYGEAAFEAMRRRLARDADLRGFRARVAQALDFPAEAVALARRQLNGLGAARPVRLSDLNRVIRHRAAFEKLARELPQAAPLYGLFCDEPDFDRDAEPTAALRKHLLRLGISARTWRLIVHSGHRLLLPLRDFYRGDPTLAATDYLRILDALAPSREPSGWPIWVLLSLVANPSYRHNEHLTELDRGLPALAAALRRWQHTEDPPGPPGELAEVFEWLHRSRPLLDKRQRRAPWSWWVRSAREAATRERLAAQARVDRPWPAPVEDATLGSWHLKSLRDPLALWTEGQAMHHCIANRESECRAGEAWAASIRSGGPQGRRLATALFRATGPAIDPVTGLPSGAVQWALRDLRGFANRDPDPRLQGAIEAWLEALQDRSKVGASGSPAGRVAGSGAVSAPRQVPISRQTFGDSIAPPDLDDVALPEETPPRARWVGIVRWGGARATVAWAAFRISRSADERHWLLWRLGVDRRGPSWWKAPVVAQRRLEDGLGQQEAARRLLLAHWRAEVAAGSITGVFDQVVDAGLLGVKAWLEIRAEVWPQTATPVGPDADPGRD